VGVVGKPVCQGGLTATVTQWAPVADGLVVGVVIECPMPDETSIERSIALVGNDGRRANLRSDDEEQGDGKSSNVLHFMLTRDVDGNDIPHGAKPFVPDHLRVTVTRKGEPTKELPFVIENVPLP
jgi:hypothetical protein